ncbi:DUF294 nucleotidyltransferase-like domain-containing protein [Cohnella terricola]|uniref:CBS domain-containing protein n=1 Tax=Cohnella terricola TaxID=1289167 RepID=A0A559JWE8_9BACL|nr:DUF294 nucleotidyltransferase-like domain-containing protein [Cohnella terricola]TVY04130.1 hypothetical protein FPZ45_00560 [Cohnella terricola]
MGTSSRNRLLLDIASAGDPESLRVARERVMKALEPELYSLPAVTEIVTLNELHDALIARALVLAEKEVARLGYGAPPVPYAYMLYGSGGRYEQTMHSDQDSGLVYGDTASEDDGEKNRRYFLLLADKVVQYLILLGYPPCDGNVITSNPEWCLSLAGWIRKIDHWIDDPDWENVRYLLIAADGRAVYGDKELADRLRDRFYHDMLDHPSIAQRMLDNTLRHKILVGVFGQLLTERYGEDTGSLDIKYGAYIPMVNAIRLLALQAGVRETSTLRRIEALRMAHLLSEEEAEEAEEAFVLFMRLRMLASVSEANGQWSGSGKVPAARLTKEMIAPLKKALRVGVKLQKKVQKELQRGFGGR